MKRLLVLPALLASVACQQAGEDRGGRSDVLWDRHALPATPTGG